MLDSLEDMLNPSNDSSRELQNNIKKEKEKVERVLKYGERDKVNIDFLLTMLGNGFINEDYRYFISKRYDGKLNLFDNSYLNTLKCELSPNYTDRIDHLDLVVDEIQDYQWSYPSVLNNSILTYLFENNMSEQIDGFINAIQNYYNEKGKDDFVKQYVDSFPNQNYAIIDNLLGKISEKSSFDPFFDESSESLFCRMLCNLSLEKVPERKIPLMNFLRKRKNFAEFIFEMAKKDESLKGKLHKLDVEIEKVSDYNDSVKSFIIDEALYKTTKENLDYVLASCGNPKPYSYFDYVRENILLSKKIVCSAEINNFVKTILLSENKLTISSEGIVSLLFNNYLELEMVNRIIERIDDESVDLVNLRLLRKKEIDILKDFPEGQNIAYNLIHYKKVKIDFSNTLYLFEYADENDFLQFLKENIDTIVGRMEKDEYIWSNYLNKFYAMIFSNDKVETEIFAKISDALTSKKIDVLDYADLNENVSVEKQKALLQECFEREGSIINEKSNVAFITLVMNRFDFFMENFFDIKWKCGPNWDKNMSILLKNGFRNGFGNDYLFISRLNSLMQMISPKFFPNIMKYWIVENGVQETSDIVEELLNENHINSWLNIFGLDVVLGFVHNYKDSLNSAVVNLLKKHCENWINPVFDIAEKYGIKRNAIADKNYSSYNDYCNTIIQGLKSHDWYKQNPSVSFFWEKVSLFLDVNPYSDQINSDLFVVGRNLYQAAEGSANDVVQLISNYKASVSDSYRHRFGNFDPILCGAVFEAYFNNSGNVRNELKYTYFDEVQDQLDNYPESRRFIAECIKPFSGLFIYVPGNDDVIFDIEGVIDDKKMEVQSIKCIGIEIFANGPKKDIWYDDGLPNNSVDIDYLRGVIGKYLAIPKSHIKFNLPSQDILRYHIDISKYSLKPRDEIVLAINYKKRPQKRDVGGGEVS